MSGPYKMVHEQVVPRPLQDVFAFFARPENLETITPDWLNFRIVSVSPEPVRQGTVIRYKLRIRGLPLRWTSEIQEWDPPHKFVDVQLSGPYKLWHHTHTFVAEGSHTRIRDEVLYELPLGLLGKVAHWLSVRRDVERIFRFARTRSAPCSGPCSLRVRTL